MLKTKKFSLIKENITKLTIKNSPGLYCFNILNVLQKKKLTISPFFYLLYIIIPLFCLAGPIPAQPLVQYPGPEILPQHAKELIIKLKPGATSDIGDLVDQIPVDTVRKVFERKNETIEKARSGTTPFYHHIWKIRLNEGVSVEEILNVLNRNTRVAYAEPSYSYQLLYIPDDPESQPGSGRQTYLSQINAYPAWDLVRNHPEPLIAVIDTGLDTAHNDIQANLYINTADPPNGIDDDEDGYTDNYYGWDFADDDPDITADNDGHGTQVSGISNAVTDNGTGIAGTGFNARLMPLKAFTSSGNEFANGFEAVIYAAERGCDVIILSWGSADAYSEYAQEVIDYVVNELDVVVIAAAGNTPGEYDFYPASYNNVLSVGAVDGDDNLAEWASYSTYMDLVAPGVDIYTTANDNIYSMADGSSFSVPMVAGTASLLKMHFPEWNARQIMEQIRVNTDDVSSVGNNADYHERMGKGRLNMYKALTDTGGVSVRMQSFNYNNELGSYAFFDDTVRLSAHFINYLAPVEDLQIHITSENPSVIPLKDHIGAEQLASLDSITDSLGTFSLYFDNSLEYNEKIKVRIDYEAGEYSDYQYFEFYSNGSSFDIVNESLEFTVSDNGRLGFTGPNFSKGNGIRYRDEQILNNFGIILSKDERMVSDNALYDVDNHSGNNDFVSLDKIKLYKNSHAYFDARSTFKEEEDINNRLGILVEQKILAHSSSPFIICEYRLINQGDSTIHDLNLGLLADWDLDDPDQNRAGWLVNDSLGIVCNNDSTIFAGVGFHGHPEISFYAVDLDSLDGNAADINSVITDSIKHHMVSGGVQKTSAGSMGQGNDVAMITAVMIDSIKAWQTEKLSFYIVMDSALEGLKNPLADARNYYRDYLASPPVDTSYYICRGDDVIINPPGGKMFEFYEDPYGDDLMATDSVFMVNHLNEDLEVYVMNVDKNYPGDIRKISVIIDEPEAGFSAIPDSLIINEGESGLVEFIDESSNSDRWKWDFGNGYGSTLQYPEINYEEEGIYEVLQVVKNQTGCEDSLSGRVTVIYKNEKPAIQDQYVCMHSDLTIQAHNTDSINVYNDSLLTELIHTGSTFTLMDINQNQEFWITNTAGEFESDPVNPGIYVSNLHSEIEYHLDTLDISTITRLIFTDRSVNNTSGKWFVNGNFHSDESVFPYDYDNLAEFSVRLLAEDSIGCRDSSMLFFTPSISPVPELEPSYVCRNDTATLFSDQGSVLAVYTDPSLTERVFKGRQLRIPNIERDTSFFITALDSLLESLSTEVFIYVSATEAGFIMDPDTLNLKESNEVHFSATAGAEHYLWEFELNGTDTLDETSRSYYEVGTYEVKLTVTDSLGCEADTVRNLSVVSLTTTAEPEEPDIIIYPNPASGNVFIKSTGLFMKDLEIECYSGYGEKIDIISSFVSEEEIQLETVNLASGLYFLMLKAGDSFITVKKIIVY